VTFNLVEQVTFNLVEQVTFNLVEQVTFNLVEQVTFNLVEQVTFNSVSHEMMSLTVSSGQFYIYLNDKSIAVILSSDFTLDKIVQLCKSKTSTYNICVHIFSISCHHVFK